MPELVRQVTKFILHVNTALLNQKMSVLNFPDLVIDIDDQTKVISEAKILANKIKPDWNKDKLKEKIFSDGITNVLVGIYQVSNI